MDLAVSNVICVNESFLTIFRQRWAIFRRIFLHLVQKNFPHFLQPFFNDIVHLFQLYACLHDASLLFAENSRA